MASSIADMLIGSALQNSTQAPDITGSIQKGAQLGEHIANVQAQRAQIEAAKQKAEQDKFEKVGSWLDTYAKMPEGPAKKAFGSNYIPTGIGALGLADKVHPDILKMATTDSNFAAFLRSKTRSGDLTVADLNNPDKAAEMYAKFGKQFGDEAKFQGVVTDNNEALLKAEADALASREKDARAQTVAGSREGQREITNLGDLRKEVTGHPITKNTIVMAESYDKVRSAFGGKPSPAGDISGVFAYMKILDPNSTVREGEQAQARNAAGVPEQIQNLYNKLLSGETLNPKQRKDFINQSEKLYRNQYDRQQALNKDFEAVAKATGINPKLIFAGTKFKAPPPEKRDFAPSDRQRQVYSSASAEDKAQIVRRIMSEFGLDEADAKKRLGE